LEDYAPLAPVLVVDLPETDVVAAVVVLVGGVEVAFGGENGR
jgi:hypothetical protein